MDIFVCGAIFGGAMVAIGYFGRAVVAQYKHERMCKEAAKFAAAQRASNPVVGTHSLGGTLILSVPSDKSLMFSKES